MVDIYEKDNNFFVEAQLPGIKKEDIKIEIENGKLSLNAESCKENEIKEDEYYRKKYLKANLYVLSIFQNQLIKRI